MHQKSKIFVTGHKGMVGNAILQVFEDAGYRRLLTASHKELDLEDRERVQEMFSLHKPEVVIMCAAKVGGILANQDSPVDFYVKNARMQMNVMESAKECGAEKLLFLGSACAYPKMAGCPVQESALLTGALEPSNEMYALAKISGVKLCDAYRKQHGCNFISAMPTNLYGRRDNYAPRDSHVIPGMIRKFHEAKLRGDSVLLWGSGKPDREFLFAEDLARACLKLLQEHNEPGPVNIGTQQPVQLCALADAIAEVVGYTGTIFWDTTKPDGTPHRGLDSSKIFGLGWAPKVGLQEGLAIAYKDFLCQQH